MKCYLYIVLSMITSATCAQEIYETVEAIAGQSAEIPCNVTAEVHGVNLNILAWYKNGTGTAIHSRDLRPRVDRVRAEPERKAPDGRYRLVEGEGVSHLVIQGVRPGDAGLYYCIADFASARVRKTYVHLAVIEPTERVWVVHENGSRVASAVAGSAANHDLGPYYVGDTVHLFCIAFGGKPQPSVSWYQGSRVIKNKATPLSERRVRIDLKYGPLRREDHGLVLSCRAHNNNVSIPISVDISLDMYLPPYLVSVRSVPEEAAARALQEGGAVREGDALRLQCRVVGARPPPAILWRLDDNQLHNLEENVTVEASQRLVVSEVHVSVSREQDEMHVTCCADAHSRDATYLCADGLPLSVHYPPALEIAADGEIENGTLQVVKGSDVSLNCTINANPRIYDLTWYHGDKPLNSSYTDTTLHLSAVSETDAGEYDCAGANAEGATTSDPITLDVIYPPYCTDQNISEFGLGEDESLNLTCEVTANPEPTGYRWMLVDGDVNVTTLTNELALSSHIVSTVDNVLKYTRPNDTNFGTVFCWGLNDVALGKEPCTFRITDETVPRPPAHCAATKHTAKDITISCIKSHDGGLPQKFTLMVKSLESEEAILSIINLEPQFIIEEPTQEQYKFVIVAFNEKGESDFVTISQQEIIDKSEGGEVSVSAVSNITTLSLSLWGGVALLALAACGLVLCAHERAASRACSREPALTAYNTEESNCGTLHDSEDESECHLHRAAHVRRTSSLHSRRAELEERGERLRPAHCRVHSLQNISRRRDMEAACDHLIMQLPGDVANYSIPRSGPTFYSMPRKVRQKLVKEPSDETSEVTQNSDGFSLPPPPDEYSSYRAGIRVNGKDALKQPGLTYLTRNDLVDDDKNPFNDVIISPMNTVGLPTASGHSGLYTYPDDDMQNVRTRGMPTLSTFQSHYSSPKESGL